MEKLPKFLGYEDALKLVMQRTGKSRRQARQALLQKLKTGEVKSYRGSSGEPISDKPIPPEFYQLFPSEH